MKFTMKKLRLNHLELQHYCMYLNGWKMKLNFQILLLYMVKGFVNPYTTIIGWVVKWTMNHYVLNLHFPYVNQCWLQSPTSESAPFLFFLLFHLISFEGQNTSAAKYEYDRQAASLLHPFFYGSSLLPETIWVGTAKAMPKRRDNLIGFGYTKNRLTAENNQSICQVTLVCCL